jgi:hypothetical protein
MGDKGGKRKRLKPVIGHSRGHGVKPLKEDTSLTPEERYKKEFLEAATQDEKDAAWYKFQWVTGSRREVLQQIFKKLSQRAFVNFLEHERTGKTGAYLRAREKNSNAIEAIMFRAGILNRLPTNQWRRNWAIKTWKVEKYQTDWRTDCSTSAEFARNYFYSLLSEHTDLPDSLIDRMDKEFVRIEEMAECLPDRRKDITSKIRIDQGDVDEYDDAKSTLSFR